MNTLQRGRATTFDSLSLGAVALVAAAVAAAALAFQTAGCTPMPAPSGQDAGGPSSSSANNTANATGNEASARSPRASAAAADPGAPLAETNAKSSAGKPAVVVELFTSEGCSSCPPADDLLRQMAADARSKGAAVYFLSFHVDYWNELGWPDPFSSRVFTDRQHAYAAAAGSGSVYTPQMIIGGRESFVGSDRGRATRGIEAAMEKETRAAVALKVNAPPGAGQIDVTYSVTDAPTGATLNVALVEDGLTVRVPRGENAGRTLAHDAVVRLFRSYSLDRSPTGSASLAWPEGVDRAHASLVAYAQEGSTLEIVGAAGVKL